MTLARKMVTLSNRITSRFRKQLFGSYPRLNFEEKHLGHLVSLTDRVHLLRALPKDGIVAELGVNEGDFSEKILINCDPQKLVLIDVWASRRYHGGLFEKVKNRFKKELDSKQIEIIRELSFKAVELVPDQYFDWVYLDTDHTYHVTKQELELLRPKIKPGGIIAGHDYIIGNWNDGVRYGVIEAVREFCIKYNWEMIFLTHELDDHPSFAIREIGE